MQGKNHMIISVNVEIALDKTSFYDKNPQHIGLRRNIAQHNQDHILYYKPTGNIIILYSMEKN